MRTLALVYVLLSLPVTADDMRVAVGMPRDKALTIIKANSGKDITPGLAVVGPKGEHPLHGFYWHLEDYKTVIELSGEEKVTGLTYLDTQRFREEQRSSSEKRERSHRVYNRSPG